MRRHTAVEDGSRRKQSSDQDPSQFANQLLTELHGRTRIDGNHYGRDLTNDQYTRTFSNLDGRSRTLACGFRFRSLPESGRMGMRRFTRLTNAFSKRVENLTHAVSLHFMYYNFFRTHQSLTIKNDDGTTSKCTPSDGRGDREVPVEPHATCSALGLRVSFRKSSRPM